MQSLAKSWIKIYLFYGAIFFSFGLLSWISHENVWELLTLKLNRFLVNTQIYSDLPRQNGPDIPVFQSPSTDAVFFYSTGLEKKQPAVIHAVQRLLDSYFDRTDWKRVNSSQSLMEQILDNTSGKMVTGLEVAEHLGPAGQKVELYLDLPEGYEDQLLNRLRNMQMRAVRVQRVTRQQKAIYHIQWVTAESAVITEISELLLEQIRAQSPGASKI